MRYWPVYAGVSPAVCSVAGGFLPLCVPCGWLRFFGKFWLLMLCGALLSTVLIAHTHVFSFLKCPMKTMVDAREIHMSFATRFVPFRSRPVALGGGGGGGSDSLSGRLPLVTLHNV